MLKRNVELEDIWVGGGLLAVLGLYVIITAKNWNDVTTGFLLLGFGIVYMASVSKEMRDNLFNFFFKIFSSLWDSLRKK